MPDMATSLLHDNCLSLYAIFKECVAGQPPEACVPFAKELQGCYQALLVKAMHDQCSLQLSQFEACNRGEQPPRAQCEPLLRMLRECTVTSAHHLAPHAGFQVKGS